MTDVIQIEKVLSELINIYSVSGSENNIADYLYCLMKDFNVDTVNRQMLPDGRYNVIASVEGKHPGPTILLTGHIDTVPANDEGWETDPFKAVKIGDKMYGRGSMDMKGGIASVLNTLKYTVEHRDEFSGKLLIAFVPDEEAYSLGVKTLIGSGIKADFGIAAEPEYSSATIGAVGKILLNIEVKGLSAHGCQPEKGINAIQEASKFIAALEQIPLVSHPFIKPQPYVTLKIEGGFKEYSIVVPERCSIIVNKHTTPEETKEYILDEMNDIVKKLGLKADFTFTVEEPYYPSYEMDQNDAYLKKVSRIFNDVTGIPLSLGYGTGVSDSNCIVPLTGIPVVNMGPLGGGLHTANEWVSMQSVMQMSEIYTRLLFD